MSEKGQDSHEIAKSRGRCEPAALSEVAVHGKPGVEGNKVKRLARFEIRFAPIAGLIGIGLAGYGVGGILGAGVALMLPASIIFVGACLDECVTAYVARDRRRRKTLRHRWFLWLDQRRRRREWKERERRERQAAERDFLERRNRRGR